MLFRRKNVEGPIMLTVPPVPTIATRLPDDASLPLVDATGHGFELLREMDLGHNLWRAAESTDLDQLPSGQIVVVAAYTPEDIAHARPLMGRFMTIVLGIGLGPQYGSRALTLGAVGYIDAANEAGDIRGTFSDAVARVRIRRQRAAVA